MGRQGVVPREERKPSRFQSKAWGFGLHWGWLPFVGFLVGLGLILSLLIIWLVQGHPRYRSGEGTVVFVSDVGAANHGLFIGLSCATAAFFFATICVDAWLRHTSRIPQRIRRRERTSMAISLFFGSIASLFLVLLSIFDAFSHSTIHWSCALVFFIALIISGVFNLIQIGQLARSYPARSHLKQSFWIKLFLVVLGVCSILAIAGLYGYCHHVTPTGGNESDYCGKPYSGIAALEWFLILIFDLYLLSIVWDLYPARQTSRHVPGAGAKGSGAVPNGSYPADVEMGNQPHSNGVNGANGYHDGVMGSNSTDGMDAQLHTNANGNGYSHDAGVMGSNGPDFVHHNAVNGYVPQECIDGSHFRGPATSYGYMQ